MIEVRRSEPAPSALARATDGCWRDLEVKERLHGDFLGKCYLCEGLVGRASLEVDHRIPKESPEGDLERFSWNNLFPAHHDCNNRRRRSWPTGGMLFPDRPADELERRLIQHLRREDTGWRAEFLARDTTDVAATNTASELQHIHGQSGDDGRYGKDDELREAIYARYIKVLELAYARLRALTTHGPDAVETRLAERTLRAALSRQAPYTMLIRSCFSELAHLFD